MSLVASYPEGPIPFEDPNQMLITEPVARSLSPPRVSVSRQSSPVNLPGFAKQPVESPFRMVWPMQQSPPVQQQRMARSLSPVRGIAFPPAFQASGPEEWGDLGDRGRSPPTSPKNCMIPSAQPSPQLCSSCEQRQARLRVGSSTSPAPWATQSLLLLVCEPPVQVRLCHAKVLTRVP